MSFSTTWDWQYKFLVVRTLANPELAMQGIDWFIKEDSSAKTGYFILASNQNKSFK